ncbi:hypothetical protein ACRALDRAFT_1068891 [Sodiomyces alcalophilus JCM 7366]|uniref:uncharacterized protein n=1 Tax=Sodiomyces alcalophilus JCM 7366 TaxID=591952 RepID=UPI0039B51B0D
MPGVITPPVLLAAADHHDSNMALQKYLILHSQHQELRRSLDHIRANAPSLGSSTRNTSLASSPSISPTRRPCSPFGHYPSGRNHTRRVSIAGPPKMYRGGSGMSPAADESVMSQIVEEERRLFDVNEAMKRALMEMLNGAQAKQDPAFRTWVQCRLMDTEKELRSERRRKSAP